MITVLEFDKTGALRDQETYTDVQALREALLMQADKEYADKVVGGLTDYRAWSMDDGNGDMSVYIQDVWV